MPKITEATGHCLCGGISFTAKNISQQTGACHCNMCRTWGGGPLLAVDCGTEVTFEGKQHIGVFNSSDWAERGFCKQCGSHLFYRLKANEGYFIPTGLFDDDSSFEFDHQVFIDEKPAFYSFANKTKNMTGAELFEQAAASAKE